MYVNRSVRLTVSVRFGAIFTMRRRCPQHRVAMRCGGEDAREAMLREAGVWEEKKVLRLGKITY